MTESSNMQATADLVDASTILTSNGKKYYAIGPVSGRISFASQQTRALNLIYALGKQGRIGAQQRVAVVGAGLAGLTVAAALLAHKCVVTVFEAGQQKMQRQTGATHRIVHPNINWWPQEPTKLAHTVELPFFDWHFAKCDNIVEQIDQQWRILESEYRDDLKIKFGHVAKDLRHIAAKNRFTILCENGEQYENFDTLIIASGFCDERTVKNIRSQSYWQPDDTHTKTHAPETLDRYVSGAGDGGLIDALRMIYNFEEGNLAIKVIQAIQNSPHNDLVRSLILDAEDYLSTPESIKQNSQLVEEKYSIAAKLLSDEPEFGDGETGLLYTKFQTTKPSSIILLDDNLANPFASFAAPIHKLMIAFAKIHEVLEFRTAKIRNARIKKVEISGVDVDKSKSHIIIRHGADQARPNFVDEAQWEKVSQVNAVLRDQNFKPLWNDNEPYPVPLGFPCRVNQKNEYIDSKTKQVRELLKNLDIIGFVSPEEGRFSVLVEDSCDAPSMAFGIDIHYLNKSDLPRFGAST